METRREDIIRIVDITDSIREVSEYAGDGEYRDFILREDLREAISSQLLQIGGAAAMLSDEFKEEHGDIDWEVLKGLQYVTCDKNLEMDMNTIWYIIHEDFPALHDQLTDLITRLEDNEALDEVTLNEEDKQDVLDRYRSHEEVVDFDPEKDDIKYQDNTPEPKGEDREDRIDKPDENYIETTEQVRKGPFRP